MKTIIMDTADVVLKRKADGAIIFTAEAQLASISQKVTENKIKGGLGSKTIANLKSDKEVDLTVRNAVFDRDWLELAQGLSFTSNNTVLVYEKEELTIASGSVTVAKTIDGDLKVYDKNGASLTAVENGTTPKQVDITGGVEGAKVTVVYQTSITTADVLEIRSDTFAETYTIEYHTIEYSVDTNAVIKDLYFQFDSVSPSDSFDLSFENGKAITPEFKFTALSPLGSDVIGRVIEVARP